MPQRSVRPRLTRARKELLDRLLDNLLSADAPSRARSLERIRARAPRIHSWLRELLAASEQETSHLDDLFRRAGDAARHSAKPAQLVLSPGTRLDAWCVIELVGSGGMGSVYRAERADGAFEMTVAIKLIRVRRQNLDQRLKLERQLLARLDHRNIARLIDGGTTEDGHAYLVMEWIAGQDLDTYVEDHDCDVPNRLDLFEQIAEAVGHAHQRQIIHGDLKPANVRVTKSGSVRLVDFGVARLVREDDDVDSGLSSALTPAFCAPEQLEGDSASTQSDVWSLGVLLQWLLSGSIREAEPGESIGPELPVKLLHRSDLIAIIDRACAEDPDARYAGVLHLLEDVRRCRAHFPVQARRQTGPYVLSRLIRRHRFAAGTTLAATLGIGLALAGALWQAHHATQQRDRAELEAERAVLAEQQSERLAGELQQIVDFQSERLTAIDPAAMGVGLRKEILDRRRVLLQNRTEQTEQAEADVQAFNQLLAGLSFTDIALATLNRDMFEPTLATIEHQFSSQPLLRAPLLQVTATTMRELGMSDQAYPPQVEALEIRRELLGNEHLDTLQSVGEMGALHGQRGEYDKQHDLYLEAMHGLRELLGEHHLKTLMAIGSMGTHYINTGDIEQAEKHFTTALEKSRENLGPDHPQTVASMNNMGALLGEQERFEQAMPYYSEVLEIRRQTLGDLHPDTLRSVSNLGWLLQQMGRLEEALPYYEEALSGRRQVLGNDHPEAMVSVNNMGFLLGAMDRQEDAEPFTIEAMNNARRVYGDDHHRTLVFINNASSLLQSLGHYERAEALAAETIERGQAILPEGHWHMGVFQARYALTLLAQERREEAEAPLLAAYEIYSDALGDDNSRSIDIANELAGLYKGWHETSPTAELRRKAEYWQEKLPAE